LRGRDLNEALEKLPELRNTPLREEEELIRVAAALTGLPFQCSVHLGGVIISPGDIKSWTPVGRSPKGFSVGQLDKDDVEALGLLKLDLLGLRMHTAIRKALEILEHKRVFVDLERIPLDDRRTYALLRSTESIGVFQVESPGQRNLLGRLQPKRFSDLIAEISLFRPGPVEGNLVEAYVNRRRGEEPVEIPHPVLLPILKETYGVILFQEQVLRVAHVFAGLSYAEADAFRRAMTKDRGSIRMDCLKKKFFDGALSKGHTPEAVEQVFEQVAAFASYGFCEAHAASFAHITYQSAYLKTHHPQAFYLGLLNAGNVGSYPAYVILNEARRRGIPISAPHVNVSELEYLPEGAGIRAPLTVVNEVGASTAARIVAERKRRGAFRSATDLAARLPLAARIMNVLALSGALNGLEAQQRGAIRRVGNA
jgi:DNA polymerase III alpha subunit